jgi:hypothetical protein
VRFKNKEIRTNILERFFGQEADKIFLVQESWQVRFNISLCRDKRYFLRMTFPDLCEQ